MPLGGTMGPHELVKPKIALRVSPAVRAKAHGRRTTTHTQSAVASSSSMGPAAAQPSVVHSPPTHPPENPPEFPPAVQVEVSLHGSGWHSRPA
eukprot:GDKI01042457.1.p1 GENE.GDKI01042457.1~~GDKI01042457.1.p1  ORF type:complete len:108 (-),score=12.52 GDKI01042457.1:28-306(-)